jgi:hypothetical protein
VIYDTRADYRPHWTVGTRWQHVDDPAIPGRVWFDVATMPLGWTSRPRPRGAPYPEPGEILTGWYKPGEAFSLYGSYLAPPKRGTPWAGKSCTVFVDDFEVIWTRFVLLHPQASVEMIMLQALLGILRLQPDDADTSESDILANVLKGYPLPGGMIEFQGAGRPLVDAP